MRAAVEIRRPHPRHGGPRPLPARREPPRGRARQLGRRLRLPAQGPRARRRRVPRGGRARLQRRLRARPGGREAAPAPPAGGRRAGGAHAARARGARADGGRQDERRHRAGSSGSRRRPSRRTSARSSASSACRPTATRTGASSPSSRTSGGRPRRRRGPRPAVRPGPRGSRAPRGRQGSPSRCARIPGTAASASWPEELQIDVAVELVEAGVAADLGCARAEQAFDEGCECGLRHCGASSGEPREYPSVASCRRSLRRASCRVLYSAPRVVPRRSARTSIGTPLTARAMRTRRWWGERTRSMALLDRRQELRLLDLLIGLEADAREEIPPVLLHRHLALLPGAPAQLHGCLVERELVGPRREPAEPAEVVEAPEHAHQRVVGRLESDVVELAAAEVRKRRLPAADLESRAAKEERVQPLDRFVTGLALGAEAREPFPGRRIELALGGRRRRWASSVGRLPRDRRL